MPAETLDELVNLAKRRGFIFQSSDLYGGLQGIYDYGPLGVELKNNLKMAWWRATVYERDDIEGLDASILTHRLVLRYSGHEATFTDPLIDNKINQKRYRLDHLLKDQPSSILDVVAREVGLENGFTIAALTAQLLAQPGEAATVMNAAKVIDPNNGVPGDWTPPRPFNMMFRTNIGPVTDADSYAYLRPETAQGIFVNFQECCRHHEPPLAFWCSSDR